MSNAANQNGSGLEQQVGKKGRVRKGQAPGGGIVLLGEACPASPPPLLLGIFRRDLRSRGFSPTGNLQKRGRPFSPEDAQRGISFIRSKRERWR